MITLLLFLGLYSFFEPQTNIEIGRIIITSLIFGYISYIYFLVNMFSFGILLVSIDFITFIMIGYVYQSIEKEE